MFRKSFLLRSLLPVFALTLACSAEHIRTLEDVAPTAQSVHRTIDSGGMPREYQFYRPASVPSSQKAPLVVMLHGRFDNPDYAEKAYHWDQTADAHGFLVAYPAGYKKTWNAGHCCGSSQKEDINEVAFLDTLIGSLIAKENADPARIYLAGMSNGGLMAYRMACESTVALAGIGAVAGDLVFECPAPRPNSILEIHGSKDPLLPLQGKDSYGDKHYIPGIRHSVDNWRRVDDCSAPLTTATPDGVDTTRSTCPDDRVVELVVLEGAKHQWPGGRRHPPIGEGLLKISQPDDRLDATAALWSFFDPLRTQPK